MVNLLTGNRCSRQLWAIKGVTTEMVGVVILASLRKLVHIRFDAGIIVGATPTASNAAGAAAGGFVTG